MAATAAARLARLASNHRIEAREAEKRARWSRSIAHTLEQAGEVLGKVCVFGYFAFVSSFEADPRCGWVAFSPLVGESVPRHQASVSVPRSFFNLRFVSFLGCTRVPFFEDVFRVLGAH